MRATAARIARIATTLSLLPLIVGCSEKSRPLPEAVVARTTEQSPYDMPFKRRDTQTMQATLRVKDIDYSTREIAVEDAEGVVSRFTASPEIERLREIRRGDLVRVELTGSLDLAIEDAQRNRALSPATGGIMAGRADRTQPPAAGAIGAVKTAVVIKHIDREHDTVEVETPDGERFSVKARDPKNLDRVKVGDIVGVQYSEVRAVSIEPVR